MRRFSFQLGCHAQSPLPASGPVVTEPDLSETLAILGDILQRPLADAFEVPAPRTK